MNLQGIYLIRNKTNNNTYVGQSKNMELRWDFHKKDLCDGSHHQKNLQAEFNDMADMVKNYYINNPLSDYVDFKKLTIDKCYEFIPYELVDNYDKDSILELEDRIILEQREIQEGYRQMTNKEIQNMLLDIENKKKNKIELVKLREQKEKEYYKMFEFDNLTLIANDGVSDVNISIKKLDEFKRYHGSYLFFKYVEYYKNKLNNDINEFEIISTLSEIQEFSRNYANYWFDKDRFLSPYITNSYRKDAQIQLFNSINKGFSCDIKSFRKENKLIAKINYDEFKRFIYQYFK